MLRRVARPLFATWFVVEGLSAAVRPGEHVTAVRQVVARCPGDAGQVLDRVDDRQLAWAVRAHGVAMTVAAGALATSKAPRTAAGVLAVLTVPMLVRTLPAPRSTNPTKDERRARRARLVQVLSAVGGALVAAGDTEGRPSLCWQRAAARAQAQETA